MFRPVNELNLSAFFGGDLVYMIQYKYKTRKRVQIPESSCLYTSPPSQYPPHFRHVSPNPFPHAFPIVPAISPSRSTNCTANPSLACHATWQCISQLPGLSVRNAITRYPPAGIDTVSRRGGFENRRGVVAAA